MSEKTYLYGLEKANHDFTKEKSFGKNIFTNAFPAALSLYMAQERGMSPNYLIAGLSSDGVPEVIATQKPLAALLGSPLDKIFWAFENSYSGYDSFATGSANRSDLVIRNTESNEETRALEIKLVAAPTSGTARKPREQQSCEIVVRPPTIEQLCYSIAATYGIGRRGDIGAIITEKLGHPMDYEWKNQTYMLGRLPLIVDAAEEVIREGLGTQTPFILNALWRTKGKSTVFDDECFDVFFWSDMAFLQLFTNAAKKAIAGNSVVIGRPARSVVWLVKSLFDYSAQGSVTFGRTHGEITYGGQTDKAGAFSGASVLNLIGCSEFFHPRITKDEYTRIISPQGIALLSPERRLDGFIKADHDYRYAVVPF